MPDNPFYRSAFWRKLRAQRLAIDHHRCTVKGCQERAIFVDHIQTRPPVPHPTPLDAIANTRSLCASHDSQVKERRRGQPERQNGGQFTVKGCDPEGRPIDPNHRWNTGK